MVRNGTEVQVLDAKTDEDLTRQTLTQIIAEDTKGQPSGLPVELLRQLVMATDHVGQEFISWYLKSAFESYQKVQGAIQNGFSGVQSAAFSPLSMVKKFVQGAGAQEKPASEELEELKKRLAELEAREKKAPKKSAAKKSAAGSSKRRKAT